MGENLEVASMRALLQYAYQDLNLFRSLKIQSVDGVVEKDDRFRYEVSFHFVRKIVWGTKKW